jgi:hypothetical protein
MEPFQTPEFEEYTYIIKGKKQFIIEEDTIVLEAGQSIKNRKIPVFSTLIRLMNPVSTLPYALLHLTLTKFIRKNKLSRIKHLILDSFFLFKKV